VTTAIARPADLDLVRFPVDARDQLRAWDASDEYLLRHLPESGTDLSGTVVIVGDRWGALTTALASCRPTQISDSFLAQRATGLNVVSNGSKQGAVTLLTSLDPPPARIDVLLVRIPKSLALLEDQLRRLAPSLHSESVVLGTGMVTEIHTSTLQAFERILGPTRTSLAVRKARLIFGSLDPALPETPNPWPHSYRLPSDVGVVSGRTVVNYAGTFSADHLDIGTRFFLPHLPTLPTRNSAARIVDLGCGNGVVGLAAALQNPQAEVTFLDESFQAVASAEATFRAAFPGESATENPAAEFRATDGLTGIPDAGVDLVLNNPPFHTHQATTDATAWRMFTGSRAALRPGGELWVVGNRHLGYHVKLKRVFGNCDVVASNPKFVVLRAVRR
jgi:16S rRNA (guanine1207-N2)-methyltransferase